MEGERKIPEFYIILIEPKYGGNIGAVARIMANFDFKNLYFVNPCKLDDECYARAMHAQKILEDAKVFSSFKKAVEKIDYLVATSSIDSKSDKRHLRNPVMLEVFSKNIYDVQGKIGLVFGREDYGLYNHEIATCDIMVKIPTDDSYQSLNLSHAVGVILYSLYINRKSKKKSKRTIGKIEKEKLYAYFSELLGEINYPLHKKENTEVMFKRIMGRAIPSKWEYHTLMGVFSKTLDKTRKQK